MRKRAQIAIACTSLLAIHVATARGQAVPAASAPIGPLSVQGSLRFSASASEVVTLGYEGSGRTASTTAISGTASYLSDSESRPFSLAYSGGYLAGANEQSNFFQNLALSQVINTHLFNLTLADSVRDTPGTPTTGLSGIAGLGGIAVPPVDISGSPGQTVLTLNTTRVTNTVSGTISHRLSGSNTLSGTGDYTILRYTDSDGLSTNSISGIGTLAHRIDARTSISGFYSYSQYSYPGYNDSLTAQSVDFGFMRQLRRNLSLDASVGPERVSGQLIPARTSVAANVSLSYQLRRGGVALSYVRGSNSGSGVTTGTHLDSIRVTGTRPFGRRVSGSVFVGYSRNTSLQVVLSPAFTTDSLVAGGEISRPIGRFLSVYGSYTAYQQTNSSGAQSAYQNLYSGTSNILGFGITYSPPALHRGH
jgi:hypothetical protein